MTLRSVPAFDGRARAGGFILVATLWILAAFAVLAATAMLNVGRSVRILPILDDGLDRELLTSAALELTAGQIAGYEAIDRPSHGAFAFRLAGAAVEVDYASESGRIDLNMASPALIKGLLKAVGVPDDAVGDHAARILAWRGSFSQPKQDVEEDALYRAAGVVHRPRRGPFTSEDELGMVLGITPALVQRILPLVTIYSGSAEVDVLQASPAVIAALPGMTPEKLDAFLAKRSALDRRDVRAVIAALGGLGTGVSVLVSPTYRVSLRITSAQGRPHRAEAVILMAEPGGEKAYWVLAWKGAVGAEDGLTTGGRQ